MMTGFMGFGWLVWLGVLAVAVWAVFQMQSKNTVTYPIVTETALDILKKRYAKGEISAEEYERMKKDLI